MSGRPIPASRSRLRTGAALPIKWKVDPGPVVPEKFAELLEREELRRARTGEVLTVAILDVDGIDVINRRHSQDVGDEVLGACNEALHKTLRGVDVIARTGADEFCILLHATDGAGADGWAARFDLALEAETMPLATGPVTCAVGVCCTSEAPSLMEAAIRARRRMAAIQQVRRLLRERPGGT